MTRDDILRMGSETDLFIYNGDNTSLTVWLIPTEEKLFKFAALVAAAEREACAKACERLEKSFAILGEEFEYAPRIPTAEDFAEYIRARGDI